MDHPSGLLALYEVADLYNSPVERSDTGDIGNRRFLKGSKQLRSQVDREGLRAVRGMGQRLPPDLRDLMMYISTSWWHGHLGQSCL